MFLDSITQTYGQNVLQIIFFTDLARFLASDFYINIVQCPYKTQNPF